MSAFFDRFKKVNSGDIGQEQFQERIWRHRMNVLYRMVAIILAIALIAVLVLITNNSMVYSDYTVVSENERVDSDDAKYIAYNQNIIKYSQDGAEAFDGNNKALWNITFEMQKPKVVTCGGYAALGDFKGNRIYVINDSGVQNEIETKLPVSNFCVSGTGVVAAVLDEENETKINLYSSEGEQLACVKCTMTKSGYPVDVSLSEDGLKLGVAYMRIENGDMKSSVAFYNFGGVGQNEIDHYVSGYDYMDCIVPKIKFINNDTAFALGDNRLVIYKGSQKPKSIFDTILAQEVRSVYYGKNNIALVYRDTELTGANKIVIYDDKGNIKCNDSVELEYTDLVLMDDYYILYNDIDCYTCTFGGRVKYDSTFKAPVLLLVPDGKMTKWSLVSRDMVQSVNLK